MYIKHVMMCLGIFCLATLSVAADVPVSDLPTGTEEITFVELGSVKCVPCRQMQPVMDAIAEEYAGKVKVVFHDVWTPEGKAYAAGYGLRLIPTQIFLDAEGVEIFRHEGFLPKENIEKLLADKGIDN